VPTDAAMALGEMAETVEGTFGWLAHVLIEARSRWGAFEAALTSLVGETSRWLLELETTPDRAVESTAGLLETLDASPGLGPRSTAPLRILVTLHAIERTDDPADVEWAERVLRTALDDLADDPDHPAAALARAWLDRTRLDETRSAGDPR